MFRSWDELTELEKAAITYSDFYKDVHGIRPRFTAEWTLEDFDAAFASLQDIAEEHFVAEEVARQEAVEAFEATIAELMSIGAGDRETAIRWIIDAEVENDLDRDYIENDPSYFNFLLGLPYSYNWKLGKEEV